MEDTQTLNVSCSDTHKYKNKNWCPSDKDGVIAPYNVSLDLLNTCQFWSLTSYQLSNIHETCRVQSDK